MQKKSIKNFIIREHLFHIFWLIVICTFTTALSLLLQDMGINKENTLMIFLIGVLAVTIMTRGYIYGFIDSILSVLIFNYFFAEPLYSFEISSKKDYTFLIFFLLASLICGVLSSKFQSQAKLAKQNEKTVRLVYDISKSFLSLSGVNPIVNNGLHYIRECTGYECSITLNRYKFHIEANVFSTPDYPANSESLIGLYSLPIMDLSNQIGAISVACTKRTLTRENEILIKTIVYQMALVLDREFIYNERERIKLAMESEHLKSTLLRSISHDIRTPLTGIMGASSFILDSYDSLDKPTVKRLVSDINEEAARLIYSVQNILDMTRISEGRLVVKKDFEAVDDLISQAVTQVSWLSKTDRFKVTVPDNILLVETDGRLMVQVLVNLLDNAFKYSGSESVIELKAFQEQSFVVFEISDNGPGIDEAIKDTLFDEFVTLPRSSSDSGRGVGLGLSICKAIVDAHSGNIKAFNKTDGGAVFRVEIPCEEG